MSKMLSSKNLIRKLEKTQKKLQAERDTLRKIIYRYEVQEEACDDAVENIRLAIEVLSEMS